MYSRAVRKPLRDGSYAIVCREPCQVGNQAALSSLVDAPQGSLFRAGILTSYMILSSIIGCMVLICELFC